MKRKLKIAIFTGYFLPHLGGVERYVDKLTESLTRLGYEIVIITSNHSEAKNYEKKDRYSIYRLPVYRLFRGRYPIPRIGSEYHSLIRKINDERADYFILNTRFHLTSLVGARMGNSHDKPVLLIEHGTAHFTVGNKILDFFGAIYEHLLTVVVKRYIDKFYGVSKNCNRWMAHFSIKASGVFYNAIDTSDRAKVKPLYRSKYPKNEVVITYAGRLIKEKGILNLLDAFEKLETAIPCRLVIAGDGELFNDIKDRYDGNPRVDILGRLDFEHVMALYKRSDIFVYPSLYPEGLPTSILEAGLMECAIVATPRGGTEEVVVDANHGTIVDGSTDSLTTALGVLLDDSDLRQRQARAVRARVEAAFAWESVAQTVDKELKSFNRGQ